MELMLSLLSIPAAMVAAGMLIRDPRDRMVAYYKVAGTGCLVLLGLAVYAASEQVISVVHGGVKVGLLLAAWLAAVNVFDQDAVRSRRGRASV